MFVKSPARLMLPYIILNRYGLKERRPPISYHKDPNLKSKTCKHNESLKPEAKGGTGGRKDGGASGQLMEGSGRARLGYGLAVLD